MNSYIRDFKNSCLSFPIPLNLFALFSLLFNNSCLRVWLNTKRLFVVFIELRQLIHGHLFLRAV